MGTPRIRWTSLGCSGSQVFPHAPHHEIGLGHVHHLSWERWCWLLHRSDLVQGGAPGGGSRRSRGACSGRGGWLVIGCRKVYLAQKNLHPEGGPLLMSNGMR